MSVLTIIGCSNNDNNTLEEKDTEQTLSKIEPTKYKVLDLMMGMDKQVVLQKGFNCSSLAYSGYCDIFTHPDAPENGYKKINKNGTINGIQVYLDKKDQIYKIVLTSRHTHNKDDIEQFKQTLSQLVDNQQNIDESLEVQESGYFAGSHFVSLSFTDKTRLEAYKTQKENVASSAASDIKNFGK